MGKYAGSMRTRTLSGAETIHVNGEVLEYLIQGNQHGYCVVHTPQCRTYGTMPYAVWNMPYGSTHPLYIWVYIFVKKCDGFLLFLKGFSWQTDLWVTLGNFIIYLSIFAPCSKGRWLHEQNQPIFSYPQHSYKPRGRCWMQWYHLPISSLVFLVCW